MRILVFVLTLVWAVNGVFAGESPQTPRETVLAFHQALASGDEQAALALLLEETVIFESGGAELSRQEYASHHLEADMAFSSSTQRKVVGRQGHESGDVAWELTRFETTGAYKDRKINSHGVETMLLRRTDAGWRIMHIHWSSRSRNAD